MKDREIRNALRFTLILERDDVYELEDAAKEMRLTRSRLLRKFLREGLDRLKCEKMTRDEN